MNVDAVTRELMSTTRGTLLVSEPMSSHTSFELADLQTSFSFLQTKKTLGRLEILQPTWRTCHSDWRRNQSSRFGLGCRRG